MGVADPPSRDAVYARDEGGGRRVGLAFCSCLCQEGVQNPSFTLVLIEMHEGGVHCQDTNELHHCCHL